tara:strand:+ start:3947 stop:5626 length:1680 start_codon:yes stop_codon:yes gene_type:complete
VLSNLPGDYEHYFSSSVDQNNVRKHIEKQNTEEMYAKSPPIPKPANEIVGKMHAVLSAAKSAAVAVAEAKTAVVAGTNAAVLAAKPVAKVVAKAAATATGAAIGATAAVSRVIDAFNDAESSENDDAESSEKQTGALEEFRLAIPPRYTTLYCDTLLLQLEAQLFFQEQYSSTASMGLSKLYRQLYEFKALKAWMKGGSAFHNNWTVDLLRQTLYRYVTTDDPMQYDELLLLARFRENVLVDSGFYTNNNISPSLMTSQLSFSNSDMNNFRDHRAEGRYALLLGILSWGVTFDEVQQIQGKLSTQQQRQINFSNANKSDITAENKLEWFEIGIPGDGNCLYGAIAKCLTENLQTQNTAYTTLDVKNKILENVKNMGDAYIAEFNSSLNVDEIMQNHPFWTTIITEANLYSNFNISELQNDKNGFKNTLAIALALYLSKKEAQSPSVSGYGDQLEIQAAARLYGDIAVRVHSSNTESFEYVIYGGHNQLAQLQNNGTMVPSEFFNKTQIEYEKNFKSHKLNNNWSGIYLQLNGMHFTSLIRADGKQIPPDSWTQFMQNGQ